MAADLTKLYGLRLDLLCQGGRFEKLDLVDAYMRDVQYATRRYDWDAALVGRGGDQSAQAEYYVPQKERRPSVQRNMGALIVSRLTSMAVGAEQLPEVKIPGDLEATDFTSGIWDAASFPAKLIELRMKGGSTGTACVSFGFVEGMPRLRVHDAKHCRVLRWADRDEFVVAAALKVYRYEQTEIVDGRLKQVPYYSVRYWDTEVEIAWNPVPEREAKDGTWSQKIQSFTVTHNYGVCPFFWCQNLPDSEREDGLSDFDGMLGRFDQINYLASSTNKGTNANVDPTLVIKSEPGKNTGVVRKGSSNAIYSVNGADYLELKGTAVTAAISWMDEMEQWCLDEACVVVADPKTLTSRAQSGEALKLLYMPMASRCDLIREQYGKLIVRLLKAMLQASRRIISSQPGEVVVLEDGSRLQSVPTVTLPPRYMEERGADGKVTVKVVQRSTGTSSDIKLNWRSYFPPTPTDITSMTDAATRAQGKIIANRTAIAYTAQVYGVKDVEQEQAQIEAEAELAMERMMAAEPPDPPPGKPKNADDGED